MVVFSLSPLVLPVRCHNSLALGKCRRPVQVSAAASRCSLLRAFSWVFLPGPGWCHARNAGTCRLRATRCSSKVRVCSVCYSTYAEDARGLECPHRPGCHLYSGHFKFLPLDFPIVSLCFFPTIFFCCLNLHTLPCHFLTSHHNIRAGSIC